MDEFLYVVDGELVLVTDAGEEVVRAGDCAAFPAGSPNGHHLQNRSNRDAVILAMSSQSPADGAEYPDIDLVFVPGPAPGAQGYAHRDGTPYPARPEPAGARR